MKTEDIEARADALHDGLHMFIERRNDRLGENPILPSDEQKFMEDWDHYMTEVNGLVSLVILNGNTPTEEGGYPALSSFGCCTIEIGLLMVPLSFTDKLLGAILRLSPDEIRARALERRFGRQR